MKLTWEECEAQGMTLSEAAKHRGTTLEAGLAYCRRTGLKFESARERLLAKTLGELSEAQQLDYHTYRRAGYSCREAHKKAIAPRPRVPLKVPKPVAKAALFAMREAFL